MSTLPGAASDFRMPRPSVEDIKSVADADRVMPPKSTYVEPKLRSGLLVYSLEDE